MAARRSSTGTAVIADSSRQRIALRGTAAEATPGGDEEWGIGRRAALGGAAVAAALLVVKRFGVDGNMDEFDPPPGSLAGRTVLITGGNTGLGRESAVRLARAGATVVITARSDEKGREAEAAVRAASSSDSVFYQQLDLADLSSVKSFADRLGQQPYGDHLDVLMNNAGVMAIPERQETRDGFERQLGVNHLGHFALVGTLLPLLEKAKGYARIINVSSTAHLFATKDQFEGELMDPAKYTPWGAYGQSKVANVLFAKELDRRFKAKGIKATAVSCHPGGVDTDLARYLISGDDDARRAKDLREASPVFKNLSLLLSRNVQLGANTQIYLAAGADGGLDRSGGGYFDNMAPGLLSSLADDEAVAARLWEESERLTGVKIPL